MTVDVVNAGAGSGKTFYLVEWLFGRIGEGSDPSRILATTFTRAAAAQLKSRLQAKVLQSSMPPEQVHAIVEKLEIAPIGTVHSVGAQILARFAIRSGLSPRLETLDETGAALAFEGLVNSGASSSWGQLIEYSGRIGFADPGKLVSDLVATARTNRIVFSELGSQLGHSVEQLIAILKSAGGAQNSLKSGDAKCFMAEVCDKLGELVRHTAGATAVSKHTKSLKVLRDLTGGWSDFLKVSKEGTSNAADVKAIVGVLGSLDIEVLQSRHLHDDLRSFVQAAADVATELDEAYRRFKGERGLVDFTDQETLFLDLLRDPDMAEALVQEIDIVAIDEFQDTNPIQLAIFKELENIAGRCLWVGDPKQAIYGFRGTDPELVERAWAVYRNGDSETLGYNRRSCTGLVELVGQVFEPIFGDDAVQQPDPNKAGGRAGERWVLSSKKFADDYQALVTGLQRLHDEGRQWGDIALLVRTNNRLRQAAKVFRERGIPVRAEMPGLLASRECALAVAGLSVVADPSDSLSAAIALHLLGKGWQDAPPWLILRLEELQAEQKVGQRPFADAPELLALREISRVAGPREAVHQVIDALAIPDQFARWGDPAQRCTNLDTLIELAEDYENECSSSGGGVNVAGFVGWLGTLEYDEKDPMRPPEGTDALTITTYHKAKGLEWKVTVLFDLDDKSKVRLWNQPVAGGQGSVEDPLAGRALHLWPWAFGKAGSASLLADLAITSPTGIAAEKRETDEARRLLYVGFTRAEELLVLVHRRGKTAWLDDLDVLPSLLPIDPPDGWPEDADRADGIEVEIPSISTNGLIRHLGLPDQETQVEDSDSATTWFTGTAASGEESKNRYANPSDQGQVDGWRVAEIMILPGAIPDGCGRKRDEASRRDIGNAVHAYLAALPSLAGLGAEEKLGVATRCIEARAMEGEIQPSEIVTAGDAFGEWADSRYPGAVWMTEAPVTAPREEGGQWRGAIDLVLNLGENRLVVIDHKSACLNQAAAAPAALHHAGQIAAYSEVLENQGYSVESGWIHFPLSGMVVRLENFRSGTE